MPECLFICKHAGMAECRCVSLPVKARCVTEYVTVCV